MMEGEGAGVHLDDDLKEGEQEVHGRVGGRGNEGCLFLDCPINRDEVLCSGRAVAAAAAAAAAASSSSSSINCCIELEAQARWPEDGAGVFRARSKESKLLSRTP